MVSFLPALHRQRSSSTVVTPPHPLHMLPPGVTMNNDFINVGSSILGMRTKHSVHEELKGCRALKNPNGSGLNWNKQYKVEKDAFSFDWR